MRTLRKCAKLITLSEPMAAVLMIVCCGVSLRWRGGQEIGIGLKKTKPAATKPSRTQAVVNMTKGARCYAGDPSPREGNLPARSDLVGKINERASSVMTATLDAMKTIFPRSSGCVRARPQFVLSEPSEGKELGSEDVAIPRISLGTKGCEKATRYLVWNSARRMVWLVTKCIYG